MKIRFIQFLMVVLVVALASSCVKDDLESLQGQIDDLTGKISEMEAAQQSALLAEIARLEDVIEGMQGNTQDLLADLQALEAEVTANSESLWYGNVLTEQDYADVLAQGASIITGKVVVSSDDHISSLVNVKMIGGNFEVLDVSGVNMATLQNIGGDFIIKGIVTESSVIDLSGLATVGGNMVIENNPGLDSFTASELVLIYGDLDINTNIELKSIAMAKLDVVGGMLMINGYNPEYYGGYNLVAVELSATDVYGDVHVEYLSGESATVYPALSFGNLGGEVVIIRNFLESVSIESEMISGTFQLEENSSLGPVSLPNLTKIAGDLIVKTNNGGGGIGVKGSGSKSETFSLSAFDNLEVINGSVTVFGNNFAEIDAFNSVTDVLGGSIKIASNGSMLTLVNAFNSLVKTGERSWDVVDIEINEKTDWFNGFNLLTATGDLDLTFSTTYDGQTGEQGDVCKVEGFDLVTKSDKIVLNVFEVTEFSAFATLNDFGYSNDYLTIYLPEDATVSMCSMSNIFGRILAGDFDYTWNPNRKALFMDYWNWVEIDRDTAIATLLTGCQ